MGRHLTQSTQGCSWLHFAFWSFLYKSLWCSGTGDMWPFNTLSILTIYKHQIKRLKLFSMFAISSSMPWWNRAGHFLKYHLNEMHSFNQWKQRGGRNILLGGALLLVEERIAAHSIFSALSIGNTVKRAMKCDSAHKTNQAWKHQTLASTGKKTLGLWWGSGGIIVLGLPSQGVMAIIWTPLASMESKTLPHRKTR